MSADELHDLAIRTRDAARLAERHGTSTHGYRRAAREACERMGEMAQASSAASARVRAALGVHDNASEDAIVNAAQILVVQYLAQRDHRRAAEQERDALRAERDRLQRERDEAFRSREAIAEDRLSRHLADQRRIDGRDETIDALTRERDAAVDAERCERSLRQRWEMRCAEARVELRDLFMALDKSNGPRDAALRHARAVLADWGMR